MGLFDRLFGKKKEVVEKEAQTPVSVEATELDHKETLTEHSEVNSVSQPDSFLEEPAQMDGVRYADHPATHDTPVTSHPAGRSEAVVPPQSDRELSDEVVQISEGELSEDSDPHHAPASPHPAGLSLIHI